MLHMVFVAGKREENVIDIKFNFHEKDTYNELL